MLATATGAAAGALALGARDALGTTPAHASVDLLVAAAVLTLGSLASATLMLGSLLLALTHAAHATGHSLRTVEALAHRCTPTVVRRVVALGLGAGLGLLGPVGLAGAAEPDLGWTVTTAGVTSAPEPSTVAPPDLHDSRATATPTPTPTARVRPTPSPAPAPDVVATDVGPTVAPVDAAVGSAADTSTASSGGTVLVRPGDSLWSITARHLGTTSPARVADEWPRWYDRNRGVIGADPDLIHAGQVLVPPTSSGGDT